MSLMPIYSTATLILCLIAQQLCKYKYPSKYPRNLNLNFDPAILKHLVPWLSGSRAHLETVAPPVLGKEFECQPILAGVSLDSAGLFFAATSDAADSRNLQKTPPLQARTFILQEEGLSSSLPPTMAQGP